MQSAIINPKAVTNAQLFGEQSASTGEWVPGILAEIWKKVNNRQNKHTSWIICDGPVDAIWIESMNTVLDDNKMLTLANAERIPMSDTTKLTFEVENLNNASPATVSRAGMIYLDIEELGWEPSMTMWIEGKAPRGEEFQEMLQAYVNKYCKPILDIKRTRCQEIVKTSPSACVLNMTRLFDALCSKLARGPEEENEAYKQYVEKWFVFCMIWSVGVTVEESSRVEIDR